MEEEKNPNGTMLGCLLLVICDFAVFIGMIAIAALIYKMICG